MVWRYNATRHPMAIKVGFGPQTTWNSFYQSGVKVAQLLQRDPRFSCSFFGFDPFSYEEMAQFDILIFIKHYPALDTLKRLRREGRILILDVQDRTLWPSLYERSFVRRLLKKLYYFKADAMTRRQLRTFDLCFVASPGHQRILERIGAVVYFLQRQLYNDRNEFEYKSHSQRKDSLVVYWTGVGVNQAQNIPILPVLEQLHKQYDAHIVYSSDARGDVPFIEYRTFSRDTWERELLEADIAFRWRDTSLKQNLKDANKIMSYMGAGLPVVVFPTDAEKRVIQDGRTGFFADTPEAFKVIMERLITNPGLRSAVGAAAHAEVWSKYSLSRQVAQISQALIEIRAKRKLRSVS
jgi:hypothetical protein